MNLLCHKGERILGTYHHVCILCRFVRIYIRYDQCQLFSPTQDQIAIQLNRLGIEKIHVLSNNGFHEKYDESTSMSNCDDSLKTYAEVRKPAFISMSSM